MKTTFKLFLILAMCCSTVAMVGCTGATAVNDESEEEGKVSGMSEEDYEKEMQNQQAGGQGNAQQGSGGYPQ